MNLVLNFGNKYFIHFVVNFGNKYFIYVELFCVRFL